MRIVPGFLIREIAGETVAIPSGQAAHHLSGLVVINGCGRFLFDLLQSEQTEASLLNAMTDTYDVDEVTALVDIREFLMFCVKTICFWKIEVPMIERRLC